MFQLIVCTDLNGAIGADNKLLASIPEDLKLFKEFTTNKICVMGSKTFDSIVEMNGKPLPNRVSIVLTSRGGEYHEKYADYPLVGFTSDVERIKEIHDYFKGTDDEGDIVICGGEEVYKQFIDEVEVASVTTIMDEFEHADAYFPVHDIESDFEPIQTESRICDVTGYGYNVTKYIRKGL